MNYLALYLLNIQRILAFYNRKIAHKNVGRKIENLLEAGIFFFGELPGTRYICVEYFMSRENKTYCCLEVHESFVFGRIVYYYKR